MDVIEKLKEYKSRLDPLLKIYFKKKIKQLKKSDILAVEAVETIADFTLAGGKRIRPALVYYGYLAAGGKDEKKILEASMSIELIHIFLLIHDDIIDRDARRHGVATVHERYKKIGRMISSKEDSLHFGNSMAMLAGDMASAMAYEIIFNSPFAPETIISALDKLQKIVYTIVPGEMLDVVMEMRKKSSEEEVLRMYEGKTSSYSFEGPLHLGAILSGEKDEKILENFSAYAMPIGKAFQIRDDIIGLFGSEKKVGKPIGSDVIEGKQTILLVKALEMGNREQKGMIKKYLGKKDLVPAELEKFRQAIRATGALEYSQNLSQKLVAEAKAALERIKFDNDEAREFLVALADYIIVREV
ncbi:MAG: polyprenyl synthetase family protein [Parcubacteria group bacterium]